MKWFNSDPNGAFVKVIPVPHVCQRPSIFGGGGFGWYVKYGPGTEWKCKCGKIWTVISTVGGTSWSTEPSTNTKSSHKTSHIQESDGELTA